jgi:hypothetical protein
LPADALSLYEIGGVTHVMSAEQSSGSVTFLSWDWCCGDDPDERDAWDQALLAAATFPGGLRRASAPALSTAALAVLAGLMLAAGIKRLGGTVRPNA